MPASSTWTSFCYRSFEHPYIVLAAIKLTRVDRFFSFRFWFENIEPGPSKFSASLVQSRAGDIALKKYYKNVSSFKKNYCKEKAESWKFIHRTFVFIFLASLIFLFLTLLQQWSQPCGLLMGTKRKRSISVEYQSSRTRSPILVNTHSRSHVYEHVR